MLCKLSYLRVACVVLWMLAITQQAAASDTDTASANEDAHTCLDNGVCFADEDAMAKYFRPGQIVPIDFGEDQHVSGDDWKKTYDVVAKSREYMRLNVTANATMSAHVKKECLCRNRLCSFWAAIGECEKNPRYMLLQCAPSCQTCHDISFEHRCPFDSDAPTVWGPGDLDKMFERIVSDPYIVEHHTPNIISKPPEGPWIITLENTMSRKESERLIELGGIEGYERSKDVGPQKFDGTYDATQSESRTSSNAWCVGKCYEDPVNQEVVKRIENITGIPDANSEYWQFLQYQEGQYYREHHDFINHQVQRAQGVRILTVFLYLNDVEEGGGTRFTDLNITVEPKQGRALLWPSVKNHKPDSRDSRTHHEALPVIKGIKYGANAWVHQRDFKTPYATGCI